MSCEKNKTETYIDSDGSELTVERRDGDIQYLNSKDQWHRLDGPAIEYANGDRYWFKNNRCHRLSGPAIERADGTKEWCQNNQLHRLDGPAIERADGTKYWCIDGVRVEPTDPRLTANKEKEAAMPEIYIDSDGTVLTVKRRDDYVQYLNSKDQRHRLDGPAVICSDGDRYWFKNNQYHRLNGPAIERADGTKEWYKNDKHHRLDGPAIEYADGTKRWYIDGVRVEPADPRLTCNKPIQDKQKTTFVYLLFRAEQQSRPVVYLSIESAMRAKRPGDTVEVAEALA